MSSLDYPIEASYIALDVRETDEFGRVCGDKIVRQFLDGTENTLFSTWDYFEVEPTTLEISICILTAETGLMYSFNTMLVKWLAALICWPWHILELSTEGEVLQHLGGLWSTDQSSFVPEDAIFSYAHGVNGGRDDELMMISTTNDITRAVSYSFNSLGVSQDTGAVENAQLTEMWSWGRGAWLRLSASWRS